MCVCVSFLSLTSSLICPTPLFLSVAAVLVMALCPWCKLAVGSQVAHMTVIDVQVFNSSHTETLEPHAYTYAHTHTHTRTHRQRARTLKHRYMQKHNTHMDTQRIHARSHVLAQLCKYTLFSSIAAKEVYSTQKQGQQRICAYSCRAVWRATRITVFNVRTAR